MGRKRQRRRVTPNPKRGTGRARVNPTVAVDTWRCTETHVDYGLTCGHHVKISRKRHPIAMRMAIACRACGNAARAATPPERPS